MSGTTPELALQTAVDSDDNADYLTLNLANSLRTIDALFNNVTGHTHASAHQGGPITIGASNIADGSINSAKIADGSIATIDLADGAVTSAKLAPPIDIAGYFRSTASATLPTTGAGIELYYTSNQGILQAYDRAAAAYRPLNLYGSAVSVTGPTTVTGTLAVTGAVTMSSTLAASGQINAAGFMTQNYYYFSPSSTYLYWDGTYIHSSHSIVNNGTAYYFSNNPAIYLVWNGTQLGASHPFVSGGAIYLSGSTSVGISWDGTWQQHLNNVAVTGVIKSSGQICTSNGYNGSNGNGFLAPNSNPGGIGLGQSWSTWACVDHAVEYGLRHEPIYNALFYVKSIPGYSYDHTQFSGDGQVLRDEDGEIVTRPLYGFKASEVAEYLPELIGFDPLTGEPQSIDLDRMVVVLWEAFKQHAGNTDSRLEALERSI